VVEVCGRPVAKRRNQPGSIYWLHGIHATVLAG
jgi:hypothetical protein